MLAARDLVLKRKTKTKKNGITDFQIARESTEGNIVDVAKDRIEDEEFFDADDHDGDKTEVGRVVFLAVVMILFFIGVAAMAAAESEVTAAELHRC